MSDTLADIRLRAERLATTPGTAHVIDYAMRTASARELEAIPSHLVTHPLREWIADRIAELRKGAPG